VSVYRFLLLLSVKYLGLLAFSKILKTHPKSVQAHKDLVLACLDDRDESIRLRALDLLYGMVSCVVPSAPLVINCWVYMRTLINESFVNFTNEKSPYGAETNDFDRQPVRLELAMRSPGFLRSLKSTTGC